MQNHYDPKYVAIAMLIVFGVAIVAFVVVLAWLRRDANKLAEQLEDEQILTENQRTRIAQLESSLRVKSDEINELWPQIEEIDTLRTEVQVYASQLKLAQEQLKKEQATSDKLRETIKELQSQARNLEQFRERVRDQLSRFAEMI